MDKLAAMRAFVAIADQGSLTAAAESLGKSGPTMVRTLAALEAELGARLMRRTTRRLALTQEGRDYLTRCRRILLDVAEAEAAITGGEGQEPAGDLRVTAPVAFGHRHVAPILARFARQHSKLRVDLLLLDRIVDLLKEDVDLAVRIGVLPDSAMIAARVGEMRRVVVASPDCLERLGTPTTPAVLTDRPCIRFRGGDAGVSWRFRDPERERDTTILIAGPFETNHALAAVEACSAGLGFGQFLAYQVAPWLREGRLEIVLEPFEVAAAPVSLVYTDARLMTSRLRVCVDFLRDALRDELDSLKDGMSG